MPTASKKSMLLILLMIFSISSVPNLVGKIGADDSMEVVAEKPFFKSKGKIVKKQIPEAKNFKIPDSIEVSNGNPYTLIAKFKAQGDANVRCTYSHKKRFRGSVAYFFNKIFGHNPSSKIPLQNCSNGYRAGEEASAKKFSLQLETGLWFYSPLSIAKVIIEFQNLKPSEVLIPNVKYS